MATLPVSQQEVRRIYSDLADEVSRREDRLGEELPVDTTADIPSKLRDAVTNWQTGRKSLRTVPACNAFARQCTEPVPEAIKELLTGLDAIINVLDDIIDTRNLSTQAKVALTLNAAFSSVLMVENCPAEARVDINDILLDYFTAVFQIPLVERELFDDIRNASSPRLQQNAAESFYAYRSRDIDAFARIPATMMDVDPAAQERILEDLRTYRGRRLLFKDITDVERDIADGDTTPVIYFLQTYDRTEDVVEAIEDLHARFTYSDRGWRNYGTILEDLEDPPEDLHSVIRRTQDAIFEPAV